jgi:hypothetical protein
MSRLVRAPRGFIRALQISRVKLNVFVEGQLDSYFYGQICQQELPGPFMYHIIRSDQIPGPGRGKDHMLKLFMSMRRRELLLLDFKGHKSAALFFVDKDIDDLRRTTKKSMHLVYTEYYEIENYVFKHGKLISAVSAACLRDTVEVERLIPRPREWASRAAILWAGWLKLCLGGCLLKADGVCNYSAPSMVNGGPGMPVDATRYRVTLGRLESASLYSPTDFRVRFARLEARVDQRYLLGQQDVIFKGKWYRTLLSDELRNLGIATGASLRALPDRLTGHLLQSLDFSENWASYHRDAIKRVIALTE